MRLCVLLLALALAGPAGAFEPPAAAEAGLRRGRPYVEVTPDPDGTSGRVRGVVDIAAPIETVWTVMTDCDLAPRMVANLKSCRILDRDPAGRWDVREYVSRMTFLPAVRNVFRSDYDPNRSIRFHRTGGDLAVFEGAWRVEPRGGAVRVSYEARIAAPFAAPGWLARLALRRDVPTALLAFRREAMARTP